MKFFSTATLLLATLPVAASEVRSRDKVLRGNGILIDAGGKYKYFDPNDPDATPESVIPRGPDGRRVLKATDRNLEVTGGPIQKEFAVGTAVEFSFTEVIEGTLVLTNSTGYETRKVDFDATDDIGGDDSDGYQIALVPLAMNGDYTWEFGGLTGTFCYGHCDEDPVRASSSTSNMRTGNSEIVRNSEGVNEVVKEAPWEGEGLVQLAVGRIYFESYGIDYACTGTVVKDNKSGRSLIFTAAHCVWDDIDGVFGTNVIFIPNRDAIHDMYGFDEDYHRSCDEDPCGCWSLSGGVVHSLWPDTPWPDRLQYDYGFYVVDDVGSHIGAENCGSDALDIAVQPMELEVGTQTEDVFINNFGYSLEFNPDFRYCAEETMVNQPTFGLDTLWMDSCGLSGGASGGPWITDFDTATGTGKVVSTNSWSYSDEAGMGAPFIDYSEARCLINVARDADMEWMMSQPVGEEGIFADCYDRPCVDDEEAVRRNLKGGHRELCSTTIKKKRGTKQP